MKKHNLAVSLFSVLCVLCAGAVTTDAFAAASVRALGGTGTVNGTAAASTATRAAPARAGSLRVTPSSARIITSSSNTSAAKTTTSTSGTTATTGQRLSIGKYLGGATTATSAGTTPASAGLSHDVDELDERVDALENAIGSPDVSGGKTLDNRIAALEEAQEAQPTYSSNGTVVVENGEVTINMDELKKEFFGSSDAITMEYDEQSGSIKWGVPNAQGEVTEWFTLVDTNELAGDYVSVDELQTKIDNLGRYALQSDLEDLTDRVSTLETTINTLTTGGSGSVASQIATAVGELGDDGNGNPYTVKGYVDDALADYTTTADLGNLALKNKIKDADVADDANIAQSKIAGLTTALDAKANASEVYTIAQVNAAIADVTGGESGTISEQIDSAIGDLGNKPGTETPYASVKEYIADGVIGDLDGKTVEQALATKQDVIDGDNKLSTDYIDGLATVATTGKFSDLIEVGTVPANDGHDWVWGYVNGEPTFIRIVDE